MPTTANQEFATGLVRRYASTLRSGLGDEPFIDPFHGGVTSVVLTAVQMAYGFTIKEAEEFVRIVAREE